MIYALLFLSSLVLTQASNLEQDWEAFKQSFDKRYEDYEELTRFANFKDNLKSIGDRNMAERLNGGTAIHGVTQFSDLSQFEFENYYLKTKPPAELTNVLQSTHNQDPAAVAITGLIDWTGRYTSAVKDQGYCASSWAFSAIEQIESDAMRSLGVTYVLSPAQLIECDRKSSGCKGGWPAFGIASVKISGGIETNANYPYSNDLYQGFSGTCSSNPALFNTVTVTNTYQLSGEANMASWLETNGPISIVVDASIWNSYTSGIVTICGTNINHAVQAVGVDTSIGGYWKVRNSWGSRWGEGGFLRLSYGGNICGITYQALYTTVAVAKSLDGVQDL